MMSITNGGTGASTVEQARTNLEVYSKTEITNLIADTKRYADRNLQQVSTSSDKSIASLASNLSHEIDRLDSLASEARKNSDINADTIHRNYQTTIGNVQALHDRVKALEKKLNMTQGVKPTW